MDAGASEPSPASRAGRDRKLDNQPPCPFARTRSVLSALGFALAAGISVYLHVTTDVRTVPFDEHNDRTAAAPHAAHAKTPGSTLKSRTACNTEDCQYVRWLLDVSPNRSKDPCENFHAYVCSGIQRKFPWWFTSKNGLPVSLLAVVQRNLTADVVKHLYGTPTPSENQTAFEKARAFFQQCLAAHGDGNRNRQVLAEFLQEHNLLPSEDMTFDPLETTVKFMFQLRIPLFFRTRLSFNHAARAYFIYLARRKLQKEQKLRTMSNTDYRQYVGTVLQAAGVTKRPDDSLVANIVAAEQLMFDYSASLQPKRFSMYEVPFSQTGYLTNDASLGARWVAVTRRYTSVRGNATTRVSNVSVEFLKGLFGHPGTINEAALRLYIAWTTLHALTKSAGLTERVAVDSCWNHVLDVFPYAAVSEVLFKTVNKSRTWAVERIMKRISLEVRRSFQESRWMDDETRQAALTKLDLMKTSFGYVAGLDSPKGLDDRLKLYPDVRGPFLADVISINAAHNAAYIDYVFASVIDGEESGPTLRDIFVVNAYYTTGDNAVYASPAMSYRPVFSYGGPPEVNYGAIGRVLAHEMMHAFDLSGITYDGYGRRVDWFTDRSKDAYLRRLRCQNESTETAPKERTLEDYSDEYLADTIGEASLFKAYKRASEESNVDLGDVGGLTKDQIFYIVSCLLWCGNNLPIRTHPPLDERCNVPLMSSVHFSQAFSCPPDSPMNPRKKCHFW